MQNFRRLHVWERAHQFALDVRKAAHSFPRTGYGELEAPLISAAESIPTNVVEGAGASSRKEFARYLDIAIKSTFEVEYLLQLAKDNSILLPDKWDALSNEVVEIRRMLYGLRKTSREAQSASGLTPTPGLHRGWRVRKRATLQEFRVCSSRVRQFSADPTYPGHPIHPNTPSS